MADRPAPGPFDGIEITPEMIEAGADAAFEALRLSEASACLSGDDYRVLAVRVIEAAYGKLGLEAAKPA